MHLCILIFVNWNSSVKKTFVLCYGTQEALLYFLHTLIVYNKYKNVFHILFFYEAHVYFAFLCGLLL